MVSGLGGDGEGNYGDRLTMAAKMVMEREAIQMASTAERVVLVIPLFETANDEA